MPSHVIAIDQGDHLDPLHRFRCPTATRRRLATGVRTALPAIGLGRARTLRYLADHGRKRYAASIAPRCAHQSSLPGSLRRSGITEPIAKDRRDLRIATPASRYADGEETRTTAKDRLVLQIPVSAAPGSAPLDKAPASRGLPKRPLLAILVALQRQPGSSWNCSTVVEVLADRCTLRGKLQRSASIDTWLSAGTCSAARCLPPMLLGRPADSGRQLDPSPQRSRSAGVAGDQQAASAEGCFEPGMIKSTYGTGLLPRDMGNIEQSLADDHRLPARRQDHLCARRLDFHRRRRRAMAARRPADHRHDAGPDAGVGEQADPGDHVYLRPGLRWPGRTALACCGTRCDHSD